MASTSVLQTLRPQLVKFLSYDDIKDYLINYKLLTLNEYQKLEHLQKNATDSELVGKVLDLVMRKGSNHDAIFVRALSQSLEESASPHRGNEELLPLVQRELTLQQSRSVPALPRLNAQITSGEEVEKDGIYPFSLSSVQEHGEFSNPYHNQAVQQGRSQPGQWDVNFTPPVVGSSKWTVAGGFTMQEQAHPDLYSTNSPVFHPRALWNTPVVGQMSSARSLFSQSPTMATVTESVNSMSLHPVEGVRGKLQSRAPVELGDFSVAQEVRRTHQDPEDLKCQIVKESRAMIRKYATLVLEVYRLLEKLSVPFKEVRLALITLGCTQTQPGSGPPSSPLFVGSSEIARARDMLELLTSLHAYSSWFNYDLIKFLAEEFGGHKGVDLIAAYEEELREFCKKFVYQCPQFAGQTVPDGFTEMEMKVDWEYQNCRTQDVAIFKTTVTDLLHIRPHTLRLKSVEEGCVLLTWMVSSSAIPDIALCLSKEAVMEKLAKEMVQSVNLPFKRFEVPARFHLLPNDSPTQQCSSNIFLLSSPKYFETKHRNSIDYHDTTPSSMTPTLSSLSDVTEASTPYHHSSGTSICGSTASKRALSNCFSNASVDEFFAETHSLKEVEILSLYSGERSPASTIDRYSKFSSKRGSRDSAIVHESHSPSSQTQGFATSEFALSDTNLHYISRRLSCSLQENRRHKSESDIANLKCLGEKTKGKEKKKPKSGKRRFSLQRIMNFRRRRALKKNSQPPRSQSSTTIATFASLPSQLSSPTHYSQSLSVPQHQLILELAAEPSPAYGGKPHYYDFTRGLSCSAANEMVTEPLEEDSNEDKEKRGDGTSVASLEWQPSVPDPSSGIVLADGSKEASMTVSRYSCSSGYSSQEASGSSLEKTLTPILGGAFGSDVDCQSDLSICHSQPCPSSATQHWKTFSYSPSSDEIHTQSVHLRNQGHICAHSGSSHSHERSHSVCMSSAYRMHHRLPFSDECPHISRVASPSCSINSCQVSSGYGSHRSSDCSLSQADSLAAQMCVLEEQDSQGFRSRSLSVEGQQRTRVSSVRRHSSLTFRHRNLVSHDASPLVSRSNSMNK